MAKTGGGGEEEKPVTPHEARILGSGLLTDAEIEGVPGGMDTACDGRKS